MDFCSCFFFFTFDQPDATKHTELWLGVELVIIVLSKTLNCLSDVLEDDVKRLTRIRRLANKFFASHC